MQNQSFFLLTVDPRVVSIVVVRTLPIMTEEMHSVKKKKSKKPVCSIKERKFCVYKPEKTTRKENTEDLFFLIPRQNHKSTLVFVGEHS